MKDLIVVGTGGLDIVNLIEDINSDKPTFNFLGFLEKDPSKHGTLVLGKPVIGSDELLLTKYNNCSVINNVMANPRLHESITNMLITKYGVTDFPSLIHPSVERRGAIIGIGNIIYAGSKLSPLSRVGNFNISYSAHVGHETQIGDYNLMANTCFGSRCRIGSFNLFGNKSVVTNSCKVGDDNTIGVCSVVMQNVKNGHHLLGYPAIEAVDFARLYFGRKKK